MQRTSAVVGAVLVLVAAGLLTPGVATAAAPGPIRIDFTGETTGAKPDGYASAESAKVLFFDTIDEGLDVADAGEETHGLGLRVFGDDPSALEIRLAGPTTAIGLAFGNDDPNFTNVTDQAQLTVYRGDTQVGQVSVNVNANDEMDQRISYRGDLFNRATFQYVDAADVPKDLIEAVDDIVVAPLCTVVGTDENDRLTGKRRSDVICGAGGTDTINGRGGDDLVYAGAGNDVVNGGAGADTVIGHAGRDTLKGGSGKDRLDGGTQRDKCDGGTGSDRAASCEVKKRIP